MSTDPLTSKPCYQFLPNYPRGGLLVGKAGDLGLVNESFSFLCWIKLNSANQLEYEQFDQAILGQNHLGIGETLHIVIRSMKPYFGFYGVDTASTTTLELHTWYHLAFVYNKDAEEQLIYINGKLDAKSTSPVPPLLGNNAVFYSQYANGRPLRGLLAAPLICSRIVATEREIMNHSFLYSVRHAQSPKGMLLSNQSNPSGRVDDKSWPPVHLASLYPCETPGVTASRSSISTKSEFLTYFESGLASDATIHCRDMEFRVHKVILAARSRYFHNLFFTAGMVEQEQSTVDLKDVEEVPMRLFLQSIYANNVEEQYVADVGALQCLLEYCSRFGAEGLGEVVEQHAIAKCNLKENVEALLPVAEQFGFLKLVNFCAAMEEFQLAYCP